MFRKPSLFQLLYQICWKQSELACLSQLKVDGELCEDKCEGTNADLTRSTREAERRSNGKFSNVLDQYENYKCPNISSIQFPFEMSKISNIFFSSIKSNFKKI